MVSEAVFSAHSSWAELYILESTLRGSRYHIPSSSQFIWEKDPLPKRDVNQQLYEPEWIHCTRLDLDSPGSLTTSGFGSGQEENEVLWTVFSSAQCFWIFHVPPTSCSGAVRIPGQELLGIRCRLAPGWEPDDSRSLWRLWVPLPAPTRGWSSRASVGCGAPVNERR